MGIFGNSGTKEEEDEEDQTEEEDNNQIEYSTNRTYALIDPSEQDDYISTINLIEKLEQEGYAIIDSQERGIPEECVLLKKVEN